MNKEIIKRIKANWSHMERKKDGTTSFFVKNDFVNIELSLDSSGNVIRSDCVLDNDEIISDVNEVLDILMQIHLETFIEIYKLLNKNMVIYISATVMLRKKNEDISFEIRKFEQLQDEMQSLIDQYEKRVN